MVLDLIVEGVSPSSRSPAPCGAARAASPAPLFEPIEAARVARRRGLAVIGESVGETRRRVAETMRRAARELLTRAEGGLPNLAVIASAAPFVGLFGTVWGIMTSFAGIAEAKDTSLAVVAPGIAEALAATAYGLAAAIPAARSAITASARRFRAARARLSNSIEDRAASRFDRRAPIRAGTR